MAHQTTYGIVEQFSAAFNRQDLDTVMALMTQDCVFDNTSPAPAGTRYVGQDAVRRAFHAFFTSSPHANFRTEEIFAAEDRCVVRWVYEWVDETGAPGYVRGVDIFRVRDGKIAEKLSYVKG